MLAAAELDLEPAPEVGQRVAGDEHVDSRQPEDEIVVLAPRVCGDAERPRSGAVEMPLAFPGAQPIEVLALHAPYALRIDAELRHPVLPAVRGRGMDRQPELARVALVIRRREHD